MIRDLLIWGNIIGVCLFIVAVILISYKFFYMSFAFSKPAKFKQAKTNHKFAILVPARNESAVICGLLESLKNQDYPKDKFKIFVIVENTDDPTCEICKKFENTEVFVRPNLDIKSKGGALDQAFKHILKNQSEENFEAFFIFDADNIVQDNFLKEMNNTFEEGYDIALAFRNSSNWNDNCVASCSALTFTMVNTCQNKARAKRLQTVVISGTGFYVRAEHIEKLGGWPFQTLTEDAEIANYAILNNFKCAYNENTQYFDEQPTKINQYCRQRLRWVKGHMQVSKKYNKKLLKEALLQKEKRVAKVEIVFSVISIAVLFLTLFIYATFMLVLGIVSMCVSATITEILLAFTLSLLPIVASYVVGVFMTLYMICAEKKKIDLTFKNAIKTIFINPVFIFSYVPIAIFALFKKDLKWKEIERKPRLQSEKVDDSLPTKDNLF